MRVIHRQQVDLQGPPGPPPRPGLEWKDETHRWIRPAQEAPQQPVSQVTPESTPSHPRIGFHGLTRGPLEGGQLRGPEVYIAHDPSLAEAYAEEGGEVLRVEDRSERPLVLDTPEKFVEAWDASGAAETPGRFHPDKTGAFSQWARGKGHDAIVIPESAFEGELGYEMVEGTVGEPQTIILDPDKASISKELSKGPHQSEIAKVKNPLVPYRTMVYPKSGKPYMRTQWRKVEGVVSPIHVIPAATYQGDLMTVYQAWGSFLSRHGEITDDLLKPLVGLQLILFKGHAGLLAVQDNRVVGVAVIQKGEDITSASPLDLLSDAAKSGRIEETLAQGLEAYGMTQ